MADVKTDQERSRNMAAVRSKNTKPELCLRRGLWHRGLRFFTAAGWHRLSGEKLPGTPDVVFPGARTVVFVDGCFWHGCPIHYTEPEDHREFWQKKLAQNTARDRSADEALHRAGWVVIRLWEHELRKVVLDQTLDKVDELIRRGIGRR